MTNFQEAFQSISASTIRVWQDVDRQAKLVPKINGELDLTSMPERFAFGDSGDGFPGFSATNGQVLADEPRVEMLAACTLTGDPLADAYAAPMDGHGLG